MERFKTSPNLSPLSVPGFSDREGTSPTDGLGDSFTLGTQASGPEITFSVPPPFKSSSKPTEFEIQHLHQALQAAGLETNDFKELEDHIQNHITLSTKNASGYKGEGQRLTCACDKSNIDYWMSRKGDKVEIELIGIEIAHGTLKTVYQSSVLTLDLDKPLPERATVRNTVTIRIVPPPEEDTSDSDVDTSDSDVDSSQLPTVSEFIEHSIEMQHELKKAFGDKLSEYHIANLYEKVDGGARQTNDGTIELLDTRYQGDWAAALQNDKSPNATQRIAILKTIAHTLQGLHERELVHGDVKAENVYLDEQEQAYLGDLDTLDYIGEESQGATRPDAIHDKLNILTPFTDIYALALMTEEALQGLDNPYQKEIEAVKKANIEIAHRIDQENFDPEDFDFEELLAEFPAYRELMTKFNASSS